MFTDKSNVIAVVGIATNLDKYGYRVYKTLKDNGYKAYAVNPSNASWGGEKVYPNLEALPEKPTLVITAVPRAVAVEVVKKCKELTILRVWMEPGSESDEAVNFCRKNGIEVIYNKSFVTDGINANFTA